MKILEKNLFNTGITFNLLLRLSPSKPHQQQLISFLHCRKTEKIFANVCVFVRYPPQFLDRSRVGLLCPLSVQKPRPSPGLLVDICSFLVHFNFFRREGKLCSSLFLLCLHKMCSQDESSVMLFWLWQPAWIAAHLSGFWAFLPDFF
ncbi:hypothetical protein CRENBAI_016360 [Crenichthys baileyi]|uniref:Uncharacterized protein n=1 Tax=Crenichthys baileyi TaxID=28760 RepID=A0AAV9RDC1_9TELE